MNSKKCHIFSKYFQPQLEPSSEEWTFEMTKTIMSLFKEKEEMQVGGEFTKEKNFSGG